MYLKTKPDLQFVSLVQAMNRLGKDMPEGRARVYLTGFSCLIVKFECYNAKQAVLHLDVVDNEETFLVLVGTLALDWQIYPFQRPCLTRGRRCRPLPGPTPLFAAQTRNETCACRIAATGRCLHQSVHSGCCASHPDQGTLGCNTLRAS